MRILFAWLSCHVIAVIVAPAIWIGVQSGYSNDSYWTLSTAGQVGVLTITICGLLVLSALNAWKTNKILSRSKHRARLLVWLLDCALSVGVFILAYIVSPQVFYAFYQQVIPDLPNQWVIESAANWERITSIMIPRTGGTLADHAAGVAVGGTIMFTAYLHRR